MSLIAKLKRRNVFRSALAYAVVAWLLVEVMELLTDTFGAPQWVLQVFVSLMVIGIVPVILFSWMYEITPEGIKRESEGNFDHSAATTQKLNIAIVIMLAIAIGLFGYQQFSGERVSPPAVTDQPRQAAPPPPAEEIRESAASSEPEAPPLVAVLPFTTVSLDGESDFFAVGVHDDLLTQLAKLESMRVISRTSVLEYKGTTKNIRDIGRELGADIIMEGGIQAAGGRIRINAQLIDADTDEHLWAETYDRELSPTNIFEVQEDIARAIATALNTTLTVQDNERLRVIPTQNMAAYRAYHRALDIRNSAGGGPDWADEYTAALQEAITLDPEFVHPRAEMVGDLGYRVVGMLEVDPEIARAAERELEIIRQLAPDSAEYLFAQAYYIYYILRDYAHAHEVVVRALTKNPSDIQILELKGWIERRQGKMVERLDTMRDLVHLDPRSHHRKIALLNNMLLVHQYDQVQKTLATIGVDPARVENIEARLELRNDADFARYAERIEQFFLPEESAEELATWAIGNLVNAYWLNRDLDAAARLQADYAPEGADTSSTRVFPAQSAHGLITYWLRAEPEPLQRYVRAAEQFLAARLDAEGNVRYVADYATRAIVAAVQGDRRATISAIDRWEAEVAEDLTQVLYTASTTCSVLGMVGATTRAVDCLRKSFVEPSNVAPFVDPWLPMYDAIREEPEFVALMADIEAGMYD